MRQDVVEQALIQLLKIRPLKDKHLMVFGVSTSEILGRSIGTSGSEAVARELFQTIQKVQRQHGFHLAFQCCEHLNRACVVERQTAERFGWEEVRAIPTPKAGGAMASVAFQLLSDAICVEEIQADAGMDIGDTLIGMHLKPVAVPLRLDQKTVGHAHLTMAYTRPKYIGGPRTIYDNQRRGEQNVRSFEKTRSTSY